MDRICSMTLNGTQFKSGTEATLAEITEYGKVFERWCGEVELDSLTREALMSDPKFK